MSECYGLSVTTTLPGPVLKWRGMSKYLPNVDWEETAKFLASIVTGAVILRALFRPLAEWVAYRLLKERFDRYDAAVEEMEDLKERVAGLEAGINLSTSIEGLREYVRFARELQEYTNRRDTDSLPVRRRDDP